MAQFDGLRIRTGWLRGNCWGEQSPASMGVDEEASLALLKEQTETAILEAFPGATVEIITQEGEGCTPITLTTLADVEDLDAADLIPYINVEAIERDVDAICERIHSEQAWYVELAQEA